MRPTSKDKVGHCSLHSETCLGQAKNWIGKKFVKKLLKLKPDFPDKGRDLIGRYIKFGEIAERVVEGLGRVGLNIDQ
jgi:hypothetical protein